MQVRIARTARRHKIGVAHIRVALLNAELVDVDGDMAMYVGVDDRGVELEMGIVPDDRTFGAFTMVHCMPTELRRNR